MAWEIKYWISDTDDNVKRCDMSNFNTSWKRYQVVAATGMVGAGIDFLEKHFDIVFAIIGCLSIAEVQFQLLHRVRHTKENKLYLWNDRPGEGKKGIPSKKQIRKELDKKHEDGKKMSPSLLSMPPWLKNLYICELQEMQRLKIKLNNEVDRLLAREHYETKDIGIIKNNNMEEFKYPVPNFSSIRDLNLDEHSKADRNIQFGQATEQK